MMSKKRKNLAVAVFVLGLGAGLTTGVSSAASSAQQCADAGGTFDRTNGTVSCTFVDPVGQSEASGGKSQTRDTTDGGQGNLSNKETKTTSGPGNSK